MHRVPVLPRPSVQLPGATGLEADHHPGGLPGGRGLLPAPAESGRLLGLLLAGASWRRPERDGRRHAGVGATRGVSHVVPGEREDICHVSQHGNNIALRVEKKPCREREPTVPNRSGLRWTGSQPPGHRSLVLPRPKVRAVRPQRRLESTPRAFGKRHPGRARRDRGGRHQGRHPPLPLHAGHGLALPPGRGCRLLPGQAAVAAPRTGIRGGEDRLQQGMGTSMYSKEFIFITSM